MIIAICPFCEKDLPGPKLVRQIQGQPPPEREPEPFNGYCSITCENAALIYQRVITAVKPSGPPTSDERKLREKAAKIVTNALVAGINKLTDAGVSEDIACYHFFDKVTDKDLLAMTKVVWDALRHSITKPE